MAGPISNPNPFSPSTLIKRFVCIAGRLPRAAPAGKSVVSAIPLPPKLPAANLILSSLSASSRDTYGRAWSLFYQFAGLNSFAIRWPIAEQYMLQFISFLFEKQYSASTIRTYASAISFLNQLHHGPSLVASFLVKRAIIGCENLTTSVDQRLPFTLDLLHALVEVLPKLFRNTYLETLLESMFLLAFHACLRVGELTVYSSTNYRHAILVHDVSFTFSEVHAEVVHITINHCKSHYGSQPFHIYIRALQEQSHCPVRSVHRYSLMRGNSPGPFFIFQDRAPVTGAAFRRLLNRCVTAIGLDPSRYKGHSFRIGAASSAAMSGLDDGQLQRMGRWSSNAFRRYIRAPNFASPLPYCK